MNVRDASEPGSKGYRMIDKYKGLDKSARIRLALFVITLLWCTFLAVYLSVVVSHDNPIYDPLDTKNVGDVTIDGADFSPFIILMGYSINGIMSVVALILIIIYLLVETVMTIIPVIILRLIGLRKRYAYNDDEYVLVKSLYVFNIGLSFILSFLFTRFVGIIPVILFNIDWILIILIYVTCLKKRCKGL